MSLIIVDILRHRANIARLLGRHRKPDRASGRGENLTATMDRASGIRLSDEQRLDWLRLIRSDNVGPVTFRAADQPVRLGRRGARNALPELSRARGCAARREIASRAEAERELRDVETAFGARFSASANRTIRRCSPRSTARRRCWPSRADRPASANRRSASSGRATPRLAGAKMAPA